MKKPIVAAALSLVTLCSWAERADSLKPISIAADTVDSDQVNQTNTLTGNVLVTRGTLTLKSDKAVIKETQEGYMSVTLTSDAGHVATFRQKRDGGPDLWVEGQAQRIEYDERAELVKLISAAMVKELEGARLTNQVNGEFISYDNRQEVVAVRNDASGQTRPGKGRTTMIIAPRRAVPASAPAPAPAPAPGKP